MISGDYIFLGGSLHGQIRPSFGSRYVKAAIPSPSHGVFSRPTSFNDLVLETETYEYREVGWGQTQRRAGYFILQSLSAESGLKLVEQYEAEEEPESALSR